MARKRLGLIQNKHDASLRQGAGLYVLTARGSGGGLHIDYEPV